MGLALSGGPIVFSNNVTTVSADSFISELNDIVGEAGWSNKTPVSLGFKWTLTSPQGLKCKCFIRKQADDFRTVEIFFTSFDETLLGYVHRLYCDGNFPGGTYQVWCNPCQIFIGVPGQISPVSNCNFQGGIPYVPLTQVGLSLVLTATDCWWTNNSFRSQYTAGNFSACYSGNLLNSVRPTTNISNIRLSSLTLALGPENFFGAPDNVQRTRFYGGVESNIYTDNSMFTEPYLVWGSYPNISDPGKFRGQLYDAVLPTLDRALDAIQVFNDIPLGTLTFLNWMHDPTSGHRTRLGCLYLLTDVSATFSRGAYVY